MPVYDYDHDDPAPTCALGQVFQIEASMHDDPLAVCPACGAAVYRLIRPLNIGKPEADTDLRDKGFAKLVRRDKGVYENVTALEGESRIWDANKPGTLPHLHRRGLD